VEEVVVSEAERDFEVEVLLDIEWVSRGEEGGLVR
jgi:hypothetical protein